MSQDATTNLSEHLSRTAARLPEKIAVICPDGKSRWRSLSFRELDRRTDCLAVAFTRIGIRRGTRTILMVRPSPELFAITFALFRVGAVPVMIDPGMGRQKLVDNLDAVGAEAFIGIPLAQALRVLSFGKFRSVRTVVTVGPRLFWGGHALADLLQEPWRPFDPVPAKPDEAAAIFFTTGSTGPPKGVVYEHAMFDAQVRYLTSHFGYREDDVDLATFPLFSLFDAVVGMTSVLPDMDPTKPGKADPAKIVEALTTHGCTNMYGSPALLENLARYGQEKGLVLSNLRRIVTAGAPVRPALLDAMHRILPEEAAIHTPYGATEVLPVSDIASPEILTETRALSEKGEGTCIGRPLPGMTAAIIGIDDGPLPRRSDAKDLPDGEIGEIAVTGPVVTKAYDNRPDANALAKMKDDTGAIWHRMGDLGYRDDRGRLWFCGRKAHRVETTGGTLFTIPCEAIFNAHPQVRRSALVGVGTAPAQHPVICIELAPDAAGADKAVLTSELLALGAADSRTQGIRTILFHPGFPVDIRHNAKIFREKLAVWAAEQLR